MKKILFLILVIYPMAVHSEDSIPSYIKYRNIFSVDFPALVLIKPSLTYERYLFNRVTLEFTAGYFASWTQNTTNRMLYTEPGDEYNFHSIFLYQGIQSRLGLKYYISSFFYVSYMFQYAYKYYNNKNIEEVDKYSDGQVNSPDITRNATSYCNSYDNILQYGIRKTFNNRFTFEGYFGAGLRSSFYKDKINSMSVSYSSFPYSQPIPTPYIPNHVNKICFVAGFRLGIGLGKNKTK